MLVRVSVCACVCVCARDLLSKHKQQQASETATETESEEATHTHTKLHLIFECVTYFSFVVVCSDMPNVKIMFIEYLYIFFWMWVCEYLMCALILLKHGQNLKKTHFF